MRRNSSIIITLLIITLIAYLSPYASAHRIPDATGYVCDFAGVLTSGEIARLRLLSSQLREANGTELVVITARTVTDIGEPFDEAAIKYFNEQGIGQIDVNNGVLILMATKERKIGIYPGKGLEGALPDSLCKEIIDKTAVPKLKYRREKWGRALIALVEKISPYVKGEKFPRKEIKFTPSLWSALGCAVIVWGLISGLVALIYWLSYARCPLCKGRSIKFSTKMIYEQSDEGGGVEKREYRCTVCGHEFFRTVMHAPFGTYDGGGGGDGGGFGGFGGGGSGGGGGFGGGCSGGGGASSSF